MGKTIPGLINHHDEEAREIPKVIVVMIMSVVDRMYIERVPEQGNNRIHHESCYLSTNVSLDSESPQKMWTLALFLTSIE
jgi:hypothetical protein